MSGVWLDEQAAFADHLRDLENAALDAQGEAA